MNGRRVRLVATAVLLLMVAGCDWTQAGMNAGHSLYDPNEPALTASTVGTLTPKFSLSVPNTTGAAPIVAGGRLFLTTFDSSTSSAELHAFDATSGAALWTTTLATDATQASNAVYDNFTIYTVTTSASGLTANAVSPETGSIEWSVALTTGVGLASSLVADQGKVFILAVPGGLELLALDGATGGTVWTWADQSPEAGSSVATPVVGGGVISLKYTCCAQPAKTTGYPGTQLLSESNGAPMGNSFSAFETQVRTMSMYAAANGLFYGDVSVYPQGDFTAAYDPRTVDLLWDNPVWTTAPGPFAVSGRSFIVANSSGLTALDAKTGASQWTTPWPAGSNNAGAPVIAGSLVYVITSDGTTRTLRTYDAVTGAAVSSLDVASNAATPMVANGFVYFAAGGTITAYAPA